MPSNGGVEDVRAYYRKILPYYEKEAIARAHLSFWRGLASRGETGRILELGSGLGRITRALSRKTPTIGIDVSHEMVGRAARQRPCAPSAFFVLADMRAAAFGCHFDLVVAPGDPFCHLTAIRDRKRALRCVAKQLTPDGRFVLEGLYRQRERDYRQRRIPSARGVLFIREDWEPAGRRDLWRARYRYRETRPGKRDRTLEASFIARAWNPREVRATFASCGLRVVHLWGDFDRRPFQTGMKSLIIVARRARSAPRERGC